MIIAKQSTARTVMVGPVLDSDGVAVTDGVVGDFKISKNGGAPAALNGSATLTHRNTGHYSLALTASDLDTVGQSEIVIDDTTNACPIKEITVIEEAVYDDLFASGAVGYPTAIENADALLIRDIDNVEASAPEHSLCTIILATMESSIAGTTWTIKRTDGSTTHVTKTLTLDASADPIIGVN